MKKQFLIGLIALFLVCGYAVFHIGSTQAAPHTDVTISYANDVRPILENRCAQCHMGNFVSAGLNMNTYETLMQGSQDGPVIVPGNAKASLLIQKISKGEMPKRGPKLTPAQIQTLTDWINAGALNN